MADLKIKSKAQLQGGASLPAQTADTIVKLDSSKNIVSTALSETAISDAIQDVADLVTLSGVPANSTTLGTFAGTIIPDGSTIKSALQSLETTVGALPDPMEYKGIWNASTNSPSLTDGSGNNGDVWYVGTAGTQFTPSIVFAVGDKAVYNGATGKYEKWDDTESVSSVFGRLGAVTAQIGDYTTAQVTEDTNLYFTTERAQDAVGSILTDSNTVDFTYDDAGNSITADVKTQQSITSDASGLRLAGDAATPGNTQYYGTNGSGTKGFFPIPAVGSAGDIQETSFSAANNVATPTNITGFAFAAGTVRGFKALVSVQIDGTADLFETFELLAINKGSTFEMSTEAVGDESGIVFTITSAGQVQYTSANYAGFVSGTIKFRAQTTTV